MTMTTMSITLTIAPTRNDNYTTHKKRNHNFRRQDAVNKDEITILHNEHCWRGA